MYRLDLTLTILKVLDASKPNGPRIAVGRWHRNKKGYQTDLFPLEPYGEESSSNQKVAVQYCSKGDDIGVMFHQSFIVQCRGLELRLSTASLPQTARSVDIL